MNIQEIRFAKLRAQMEERGLDAVYVRAAENHLYMSHFDNPDGYLFLTKTDGWVFADFRYTEAAKEASFPGLHVCEPGKPKVEELVVSENCRRIGYEDGSLTCAALADLKKRMLSGFAFDLQLGSTQIEWHIGGRRIGTCRKILGI